MKNAKHSKKNTGIKVTCFIKGAYVKLYINGVLHLTFVREECNGFQSWKDGSTKASIEINFKSGEPILCEYDSKDKWLAVIKGLDEIAF